MVAGERLIGRAADLVDGGAGIRFEVEGKGGPEPAFVVRFRGKVHAYVNRCRHVPVELDWQPGEFFDTSGLYLICATHGALYAPDTGYCVGGPCAGKGLVPVTVIERDGQIFWKDE